MPNNGKKVSYFYDAEIGNYHYGNTHPMKPHRIRMADTLIRSYGLDEYMTEMVRSPFSDPLPESLIVPRHNGSSHKIGFNFDGIYRTQPLISWITLI